jgi:hypothetical protein
MMMGALSDNATKPRRKERRRAGDLFDMESRDEAVVGAISFLRAIRQLGRKELLSTFQ